MATINDVVRSICPEFPFTDRNVIETMQKDTWYKINRERRVMFTPPVKVLKYSSAELERFIEAIKRFNIFEEWETEFDWNSIQYIDCTTVEECRFYLDEVKATKYISCDIETRNLGWDDNKVLAIGFGISEYTVIVIRNFEPEVLAMLQDLFSGSWNKFIWQNGKFDISKLKYILDLDARVDEDTMLMHFVGVNEKRGTHGLKDMGQLYLEAPEWDDELNQYRKEWCRRNKVLLRDFQYDMIDTQILLPYLAKDCVATLKLYELFKKLMRPESWGIYRYLIEASNVFSAIELQGITINTEYLGSVREYLQTQIDELEAKCNMYARAVWDVERYMAESGAKSRPKSINMSSPKQLLWILQQYQPNVNDTSAGTLKILAEEDDIGIAKFLLQLRKVKKQMDTYIIGLSKALCSDNRIRASYNLHGTETGRLSCNNPNMQNIPRDKTIKNLFVASEGHKLLQLDYSQAELRVLAYLSQDKTMLDIYENGKDLHSETARKIFGDDFTKEQRTIAKSINFGIAYGLEATSLSRDIGISVGEAARFIRGWKQAMPEAQRFITSKRNEVMRGEPSTTPFGRQRHYILTPDNYYHVQNEAVNTPIQSIASDLTLLSLLQIAKDVPNQRIIATVHDSIVLEVPDDEEQIKDIARQCIQIMSEIPQGFLKDCNVPFVADAEVGYSWGDLEELKV